MIGYSQALKYPKLLISGQWFSSQLNDEDLSDYLRRSYNIASGEAAISDTKKSTIIQFLEKKKLKAFLYIIGLLMKCDCLSDLKELLFDIFLTLSCK